MSTLPTIVFVPGAWHKPTYWSKVVTLLSSQGYKTLTPSLPSTEGDASTTLLDDITAIRTAIISETSEGRDVVVVVHSFGSIPGASALRGLTKPKDGAKSAEGVKKQGYVIGFALIATGFASTGLSFLAGIGGTPPPFWRLGETGFADFTISPSGIRELFYHDLPQEEGEYWLSQLTKQSLKPLCEGGELVYSGWKDVPCWFLATTEDRGFGPGALEIQKTFVNMAREAGANVTLREVVSSHSPMLSRPEEVTGFLVDAVKAFVG